MKLKAFIKKILRPSVDSIDVWRKTLARLEVGNNTSISKAHLSARGTAGCSLIIGSESLIENEIVFEKSDVIIQIGSRTQIGGGTILDSACKIIIGDDVMIAFGGLIMDHDSHSLHFIERKDDVQQWAKGQKDWGCVKMKSIQVENKVWIGAKVIILKGVTIGEGAVVGAGSVVTKDVPPWTVVAGNPARVIRSLDEGRH